MKPDISNVGVVDKGVEGEGPPVQEVHVLHPPKSHTNVIPLLLGWLSLILNMRPREGYDPFNDNTPRVDG